LRQLYRGDQVDLQVVAVFSAALDFATASLHAVAAAVHPHDLQRAEIGRLDMHVEVFDIVDQQPHGSNGLLECGHDIIPASQRLLVERGPPLNRAELL
jgi:hypothetical protein